jgi:hypothetical protein
MAFPVPKENAAPTVTIERIAVKALIPDILDIASPSCAASAVPKLIANKPRNKSVVNR